jgi:hypothetical protein
MMLLEESKGQNLHNCAGKRILSDNTTLKIHDKKTYKSDLIKM